MSQASSAAPEGQTPPHALQSMALALIGGFSQAGMADGTIQMVNALIRRITAECEEA